MSNALEMSIVTAKSNNFFAITNINYNRYRLAVSPMNLFSAQAGKIFMSEAPLLVWPKELSKVSSCQYQVTTQVPFQSQDPLKQENSNETYRIKSIFFVNIFRKLSKISINNSASVMLYTSWYYSKLFLLNLIHNFWACVKFLSVIPLWLF